MTLLEFQGLDVEIAGAPPVRPVEGLSLSLRPGEMLGLVGESGSGKTMAARAILGLLPEPAGRVAAGSVRFRGQELSGASEREMCRLRGKELAMIFQDPALALNPVRRVGKQIMEVLELHGERAGAKERALQMLRKVHVPDPERVFAAYPHQLSGGLRQRVVLAIALVMSPALLLADEPTTALDVTMQAQVLRLLVELCRERGTAVLLISHDLALVSTVCERLAVMYAGRLVETGPTRALLASPRHPYTAGLLAAVQARAPRGALPTIPGQVPAASAWGPACRFADRCASAQADCRERTPVLEAREGARQVACLHPLEGER